MRFVRNNAVIRSQGRVLVGSSGITFEGGKPMNRLPGFNVIGFVSRQFGLGVMARNLIRLLLERGYPVAVHDLSSRGLPPKKNYEQYEKYFVKQLEDLPVGINIFALPVCDATRLLFSELAALISRPGAYNVYFPMWELDVLPDLWVKGLSLCDLIVAHTEFIRSTCKRHLPSMPVIYAQHPLYLTDRQRPAHKYSLPKASTIFVFGFEPCSDVQRKNPFAVIRSFKLAFRTDPHVALVIKINNPFRDPEDYSHLQAIRRMCSGDNRIRIMTSVLSYEDVISFYRSCDVFVSLHRSEGLGLGLMEAMMLGKPVIATGWSGNMSYMNSRNACLVNYKLIPAKGSLGCYRRVFLGREAFWAEPSIRHAAKWMRMLVEDPVFRKRMGRTARRTMAAYQKKAKRGFFIKQILHHYQKSLMRKKNHGVGDAPS